MHVTLGFPEIVWNTQDFSYLTIYFQMGFSIIL